MIIPGLIPRMRGKLNQMRGILYAPSILILVPLEECRIDHPLAASFMHPSHAGRRVQMGLNRGFRPRLCRGFAFKSFAVPTPLPRAMSRPKSSHCKQRLAFARETATENSEIGLDGVQEVVLAILLIIASKQADSDSLSQLIEPTQPMTVVP